MAVIKKTSNDKSKASAKDLFAGFQKEYGEKVGSYGGTMLQTDRVPTGLFPLDLAMGGGFPRGRVSIIFGPESSGKTNIVLKAIAQHQKLWPHLTCVFFDLEGSFDPAWAALLGVDVDQLLVIRPSYAEQMVDMCESLLYTEDCGLVAIDSLAAMVTTQEADSSAEKANVGGAGLVTGKLVRKTTLALTEAEKQGRRPTVLYVNQIRHKIGVMYGNPETQPGGNAPQFQASIRLRVFGKNIMESKISKTMPVIKETTFTMNKWKVPILSASGKFSMVALPHDGMQVGFCDDFNTVSAYLKTLGMFEKGEKNKGWLIVGDPYNTIAEFKERLYADYKFGHTVRTNIIEQLILSGDMLEDAGE